MANTVFEMVIEVIFWIFLILFVIQVILKITENSPSLEMIIVSIQTLIVSYLLVASFKVAEMIGNELPVLNLISLAVKL